MTPIDVLDFALFGAVCSALLLLPFLPAWREWRRPSDQSALPVLPRYPSSPTHFEDSVVSAYPSLPAANDTVSGWYESVTPGLPTRPSVLPEMEDGTENDGTSRHITYSGTLVLAQGCCFERVHAPVVQFGTALPEKAVAPGRERQRFDLASLPNVRVQGPAVYRVTGDCEIPAHASCAGALIVTGTLSMGTGSLIVGDVRARRGILLGTDAVVQGAVVSDGSIHFLAGARAHGPVASETNVLLSSGTRTGNANALTTVTAPTVMAETGAMCHGTVWARQTGVVWGLL
jgi:hypothetical protein